VSPFAFVISSEGEVLAKGIVNHFAGVSAVISDASQRSPELATRLGVDNGQDPRSPSLARGG
jgi:hypothetical protein